MKKLLFLLPLLILFGLSPSAQAEYFEGWQINSFNSNIQISSDGSVKVREEIIANFKNEAHHGLLRAIPYLYSNKLTSYNARLSFQSATNEKNLPWDNTVYKNNGYLTIESRAPNNQLLQDKATFIFNYQANRVLSFFEDHDEFYWNINGDQWPVPTDKASATIKLPGQFQESDIQLICYTGTYGSTAQDCSKKFIAPDTVIFQANSALKPYENLSIAISLPSGSLTKPSALQQIYYFITDNWGPYIVIITSIIMYLLWRRYGRDDQNVPNTIMPHYEPPKGMLPTEVGVLIDERLNPRDLTATIIDLAVRGYIKIEEIDEQTFYGANYDYKLTLIKDYLGHKEFEKSFVKALFDDVHAGKSKKVSELKNKFHQNLDDIQEEVMQQLIRDNYLPHNPDNVRMVYYIIGIILLGGGAQAASNVNFIDGLGVIISGLIIIIAGQFMPHKTTKGTQAYYQLKGLYEYINTAEKDRLKFQEEQNILFEKLLPYAMAFGLIKKWSNAFEGLLKEPPHWLVSPRWHNGFTLHAFADTMDGVSNQLITNAFSKPGSKGGSGFGGGGFSGGGFGGGGGRGL